MPTAAGSEMITPDSAQFGSMTTPARHRQASNQGRKNGSTIPGGTDTLSDVKEEDSTRYTVFRSAIPNSSLGLRSSGKFGNRCLADASLSGPPLARAHNLDPLEQILG